MARSEESVAGAREEMERLGGTTLPVAADATDPASVQTAFEAIRAELGDPEVFVYNAGAFEMGGIREIVPERFDECFRANCADAFCIPVANSSIPELSGGQKR
jgi:NAD(P)-dependent dehydrogenase (short-subunit alcohol dehydrogenase family)